MPGTRKAYLYWGAGVVAYLVAVFHRSALGVTGLEAAARFDLGAAGLSALAMLQLLVYAALQVPVGILVDRLGSKKMLIAGAVVLAAGNVVFALSGGVAGAIVARILIGAGDAATFISVIRIVNLWFPPHRSSMMVQTTGLLGSLGGVLAAVPLISALHTFGWRDTFLGAAGLSVVAFAVVVVVLREARPLRASDARGLRAAWSEPGTRLGLWTHAATQSSVVAFLMLWGYPFLLQEQNLSPTTAGALLTTITVASMVCQPIFGWFTGRRPDRRWWLVLGIVGSTATAWTAVLLWPGPAPLWLLVVLMVVLSTNGPGSVIGFDFARSYNPDERIGVATGIVNGGGFLATVALLGLIGVGLDVHGDFRWALAVQYPIWAIGAFQVVRLRQRIFVNGSAKWEVAR
ncbi:MFS transporter [Herbidospora mongoliensis]|uniref:MFS transporter n=1 Tax=Herbidospora mongoliensis TaxID=688067 RepID=UPI00082E7877|nr:MFS transporter [Herbidospora mongoliensis]